MPTNTRPSDTDRPTDAHPLGTIPAAADPDDCWADAPSRRAAAAPGHEAMDPDWSDPSDRYLSEGPNYHPPDDPDDASDGEPDGGRARPPLAPGTAALTIARPLAPSPPGPVPFDGPVQFSLGFSRARELEDVREQVERDDVGKWDATVLRQELTWWGSALVLPHRLYGEVPARSWPTRWATAQLCQQLGIPTAYFRRCPEYLQEAQVEYWAGALELEGKVPDVWLLRGKGDTLRGVLSSRYARLDNRDLLDCLLPLIDDRFQVAWVALTDTSFHLRLVDPALSRDATPGDRLMAGLHVGNSEVGKRSVSVDAVVFRQVCSNGLVRIIDGRGLLRQRHVSLDPPRFRERLSKAISAALIEAASFLSVLARAVDHPVPDAGASLLALGEQWDIPQRTQEAIRVNLLAMPSAHQGSLYGLVNAITQAAQGLAPDERYELEARAGWLAEHGVPKVLREKAETRDKAKKGERS